MSFPYRLVATDLDGTLLGTEEAISQRTRDALVAAQAAGAAHIVVTGRGVPWTRYILDDLGYTGLAVCGQGAQLYDAGEHRLLTSVTLDRAVAQQVVKRLELSLGPLSIAGSRDGLNGEVLVDEHYRRDDSGRLSSLPYTDRAHLWAEPLIKLYIQHPSMTDDELATAARDLVGGAVGVVVSGSGIVELLPLGLTKATGLALAGRRLGVKGAETIAFGDMPNDIPMFAWAAHGVAMADAHPELIAVADEVTAGNDADGIAKVLERLLR